MTIATAACSPWFYLLITTGVEIMTQKKKRQKVVAEITASHLVQLAADMRHGLNNEQAIAFLNNEGHAYEMWKWMMHAGEEYLRCTLAKQPNFAMHSTLVPKPSHMVV